MPISHVKKLCNHEVRDVSYACLSDLVLKVKRYITAISPTPAMTVQDLIELWGDW